MAAPVTGRIDDPAQWTYLPTWAQRPLPVAGLDSGLRAAGPWLLLGDDPRVAAMAARLAAAGAEVITAHSGTYFAEDDTGDFRVRPAEVADLAELLRSLLVAPRTILHGFAVGTPAAASPAGFDAAGESGIRSVLALVAALADDPTTPNTELVLLTAGTVGVLGRDLCQPEHATLSGLAPSLAQENPALACRHIDIGGDGVGEPAADVEQALAAMLARHEGPVAVRDGDAWLRAYVAHDVALPSPEAPLFGTGDVVLITGGLGDVGLVLSRHLATTYGCRLVLTVRTTLPPREDWSRHVEAGTRAARHIRNLLALEAEGVDVLAVSADVADQAQMQAVVDAAVARFGRIDGVVHGAGVQDPAFFGLAHLSDRATCDAHLRAKVHGFLVLQAVLGAHAPDRRITLSSVSAVLGGIALGPYSAANSALDAYARAARRHGDGRWITVDWDTWAIDQERLEHYDGQAALQFEMAPAEGIEIFERALAAGDRLAQIVVSTGPLDQRIAQWVTGGTDETAGGSGVERTLHPRPDLATAYVEPTDGLEAQVAAVWAATLALESVGAIDNFFELGGHSLIAIQLNARLRTVSTAQLPITALVEHPTVRELAALMSATASPLPAEEL